MLACALGCTCRDKPSWRGHSCDTDDNQRSSGVVIARSHSFRALDHQRRDLHFNRLYLTSRKIRPSPLSANNINLTKTGQEIYLFSNCGLHHNSTTLKM